MQWRCDQNTHLHREEEEEEEKEEDETRVARETGTESDDVRVRGTRPELKPDAKTEPTEVRAANWIRQDARPDLLLHKFLRGKVLLSMRS